MMGSSALPSAWRRTTARSRQSLGARGADQVAAEHFAHAERVIRARKATERMPSVAAGSTRKSSPP